MSIGDWCTSTTLEIEDVENGGSDEEMKVDARKNLKYTKRQSLTKIQLQCQNSGRDDTLLTDFWHRC